MSKLLDILKQSKETIEEKQILRQAKQAAINTQQEILDLQTQIENHEEKIDNVLTASPFSASKLYAVRTEKELLERKLEGLKKIQTELF
jgi:hypothetical protein